MSKKSYQRKQPLSIPTIDEEIIKQAFLGIYGVSDRYRSEF
ncbi:MAG: hypothetical protein QMC77_06540 [Methanocellales archaeon]|nr:hypothetical protein [Methanocellales archaeon]